MLTPAFYLHAALLALSASCFSGLLQRPGMLLGPLAAAVRAWYWRRYDADPDHSMLLKPLLLCPVCVGGQWALWGYLLLFALPARHYWPLEHLYFVSLTLLFASFFSWLIHRLQS